jgi:hypothetical protein
MDNGKLTDANGREVNFSNVILVMTSNVGAQTVSRASIGFNEQDHISKRNNFTPIMRASCLQISVFPTPVGPANKNDPIGLSIMKGNYKKPSPQNLETVYLKSSTLIH